MKKKVLLRGLLGFPLGICMGYIITILISLGWGQSYYTPCVPDLITTMGSEIGAVVLQAALSGLLGAVFAMCSVIWEIEDWSIMRQTGTYFAITAVTMMPIAYLTNWMEHTVAGFFLYFGVFAGIFVFVWVVQYFIWRSKIRRMNEKVGRS